MIDVLHTALSVLFVAAMSGLLVLGGSLIWIASAFLRRRRAGLAAEAALRARELPANARLPHVLVQLPVYNEPAVVARVIDHAARLDWPKAKLHVQVLDDSTDETTEIARKAAAAWRRKGFDVTVLRRPDRGGFKAGALRAGLAATDAPFAAIFDADFMPEPGFLRDAMRPLLLDDRVGFSQARVDFKNTDTNWLTRVQTLLLDAHSVVEQCGRHWSGYPFPFNGTCGIWRRAAIEQAGDWQGDTIVEDLDLSTRVQLCGWRGVYQLGVSAAGEMPDQIAAWKVQQDRWSSGITEVMRKLLPTIWSGDWGFGSKLAVTLQMALPVFMPLVLVAIAAGLGGLLIEPAGSPFLWGLTGVGLAVMAATVVAMTLPGHLTVRGGSLGSYMARMGLVPCLYLYLAAANFGGVVKALRGHDSIFVRTPKKGAASSDG